MTRWHVWVLAATAASTSLACHPAPPAVEGDVNLLLITLDTLRADRLGAYGYENAETPNLDRLAREGARFEEAISPVPLTLPSHATILTGLFPMGHQVRDNGTYRLASEHETLAEVLSGRGYRTAAFVSSFVLDSRFGLAQGYDTYFDFDEEEGSSERALRGLSEVQRRGGETAERALAWLSRQTPATPPESESRPFFLWLHLYDPHSPFDAPEPFGSRFSDRPYDGEVAYTDAVVGRVLDALDDRGLADETLVIVVGDHGESLGEHGEEYHSWFVYDATVKVPLLVRLPRRVVAGRVIAEQVRLADLAPTALALMRVPEADRPEMQGANLATWIENDDFDEEAVEELPAYSESLVANLQFGWGELEALRFGGYKYIDAPRPELYDLTRDPGETRNVIASGAATARDLRARLRELKEAYTNEAGAASNEGEGPALDDDTLRKLQSLGYIAAVPSSSSAGDPDVDPKDRIEVYREFSVVLSDAMAALDRGEAEEAVALLQPLARKVPTHSLVHFHLGQALVRSGDPERGAAELELALDLSPAFAQARSDLAGTLVRSGRPERAIEILREGLEHEPKNPLFLFNLGFAHHAGGNLDEALSAYEAFVDAEGGHPRVLSNLAALSLQRGDPDTAIDYLGELVTVTPTDAMAWNNLGLARMQAGLADDAGEAFEEAVALAPDNLALRKNLLLWYQRAGRHRDAQSELDKVRELERQNSIY